MKIYPKDFEHKLGFDDIRTALSKLCAFDHSRRLVEDMSCSNDFNTVSTALRRTSEMKFLLDESIEIPRPALFDIAPALNNIKVDGSYLNTESLMRLLRMLQAMKEVHSFYCKIDSSTEKYKYPYLADAFKEMALFPSIAADINRCIDKFGNVADNASPELLEIRRRMASASGAVSKAMRRAFDNARSQGLVDKDTAPAMRDGRMVIPVAAAHKRSLAGIIHDESATGKTVFIEPAEVVEASNRLRELQMEEQREIINILMAISASIRPEIPSILHSVDLLALMDFILAKARFALDTGGNLPTIHPTPLIEWYSAVHPGLLLSLRRQGRSVEPLNLTLDARQRFLIVSGPNAGGKSVVLKTVGVVQYMAQCGMLPTLNDNSHLGIFSNIFVDIGDEQSIENDLSTYSSHLRNMKFFLQNANDSTLLLADEMGSGTEPQIGGALAQSILDSLADTGCMGIVTTHYQNLKTFADEKEGFVNGAMMYDRQHLRPTFQLSVGNPGSSFALNIANSIGLPHNVIEKAKEIVGSDYVNMDKYLLDIDRDRRYWTNKRQSIKEKEHKLDTLLAKYEDTSADLRTNRNAILRDARKEAEEIISSANARIEATIREIREVQAEKERTKNIRQELADYRKSLQEHKEESQPELLKPLKHKSKEKKAVRPSGKQTNKDVIEVGSYVKMSDGGISGKVLGIQGKRAEVAFGALRTSVDIAKLKAVGKPKESAQSTQYSVSSSTTDDSRQRQLNFKQEIDVRGMRGDEAVQAVSYFLDDSVQFSIPRVRILHGTGHGILKTLIREQLRVNPYVESFYDEDVRFGGAGITIVNLSD